MDYYRRDPNMLWSPAPFPMLGKYINYLFLGCFYEHKFDGIEPALIEFNFDIFM